MAYAKELREKLPRLAMQMQAIVDKAKNESNRGLTSEEREQFHAIEADYTAIEDSIKVAEKASSVVDELAKADKVTPQIVDGLRDEFKTSPKAEAGKTPHAKAFNKYMRFGMSALNSDEQKLMNYVPNFQNAQTLTTTGGGYMVPSGFSNQLEAAKKWFGGIPGTVDLFQTETGQPLPWPTMNDTNNTGSILGINTQVSGQDFAFNQVTFNAYIGSSNLVLIPLALIQDAAFDLDALTAKSLGTRLGRLFNTKCTVGTGSNEPYGIVPAVVAANGSSVYTLPTGNTTAITYAGLVNLEHTVDPAYRMNGAKFMFSDTVLKTLKLLVDGQNRPLWQPGITASFRDGAGIDTMKPSILGYEYVINNDMAVPAANAYSMVFGDLSTFKVRQVKDTTVLRLQERYADYLQVGFIAFNRFDSQYVFSGTNSIAVMKQSAT